MNFRHWVAYMPSYLHQLWHCVWFAGLIAVFSAGCYKLITIIIELDVLSHISTFCN